MRRVESHVSLDGGASQDVMRRGRGASLFNNENVDNRSIPSKRWMSHGYRQCKIEQAKVGKDSLLPF